MSEPWLGWAHFLLSNGPRSGRIGICSRKKCVSIAQFTSFQYKLRDFITCGASASRSVCLNQVRKSRSILFSRLIGHKCSLTMSINGIPKYEYFNVTAPAEYVAYVEINRPKKLNAFCNPMWYEMKDIFARLSAHPDVRAVLLCSAGERAFTAGLDVQQASESGAISGTGFPDPSRKAFSIRRHVFDYQDCVTTLADCEKPVIALCHGITFGLG